jgi:LacI family transcriptional regulator, repressor for deo operon, udp, cdd, tsx, nupC, and nupG
MAAKLAIIAAQAQVSEATVSRVLNDKPGVSPETRQRVLAALDVLGIERPSTSTSTSLVGLILPELSNPIFPAFVQVIENVLTRYGYTPILCTQTPGGSAEDELTSLLVDRGAIGIIFVSGLHADSTADVERYARLTGRGVPFVLVNGNNKLIKAPSVSVDDQAAMWLAVQHLVELGHERIGLAVGPRRFLPVLAKIEGFVAAMGARTGINPERAEGLIQHSLFSVEGGQAAAHALLDRDCTAIICASDLMAFGAIRAARMRGRQVPRDVSVIGFDDSPLIAFADPPLTTIRQPVEGMGQAAVNALLEEISGNADTQNDFVFRPELVVRGSTGAVPRPGGLVPNGS